MPLNSPEVKPRGPTVSGEELYEAAPPSILTDVDSLLHPPTTRPANPRSHSWTSALTARSDPDDADDPDDSISISDSEPRGRGGATSHHAVTSTVTETETSPLLSSTSRTRSSKSRTRRVAKWYRRPSPAWLLPGTFLMAISMGMTYAPKLEIYTQLICRSMDPAQSKVTLPPPVLSTDPAPSRPFVVEYDYPTAIAFDDDQERAQKKRDQEWANQCHRSPAVQSAVARLALLLTLMMGILSSLTTGWWGSYSDRKGRKPVLILAMFGTVAMDAVFLITVNYHHVVSYNFLVVGPILDGLVGGFSTAQATTNAYLSDCTCPGSRAKVFSLVAGLMFAGFAIGPVASSALLAYAPEWFSIRDPTQVALVPFYVALTTHVVYLAVLAVALPESLAPDRRDAGRARHDDERRARLDAEGKADQRARDRGHATVWARKGLTTFKAVFGFLRPLGLLLPKKKKQPHEETHEAGEDVDHELRANIDWGEDLKEYWDPDRRASEHNNDDDLGPRATTMREHVGWLGRDWSLTKIAFGYSTYMMIIAIIQSKLQYANYTFDWSAREDGLFLSYIGVLRVVALVVFLPLLIRILRQPAPEPIQPEPSSDVDVDDGGRGGEGRRLLLERWHLEKKWLKVVTDSHFDLALARVSLLVDFIGFVLFGLTSLALHPTPVPFLVTTFVQSLGSGASPALQSLALAHSTPRDSGRLFASLSVVQSLSSQVVGPILFGTTFINTVGKGPWTGTIFWVAALLCLLSWTSVSSLSLRRVWIDHHHVHLDRHNDNKNDRLGSRRTGATKSQKPTTSSSS